MAEFIRFKEGKKAVEPYFKETLIEKNSSLAEYFEGEIVDLKFKPRKKKKKNDDSSDSETEVVEENQENLDENGHCEIKRPLVWCSDMDKFLHYLMSERGYNPNELDFKIGIDFGQESLKVILLMTLVSYLNL